MSYSLHKWSRLTGRRSPGPDVHMPEEEQLVVSSDVARMYPPVQGVVGADTFLDAFMTVDPPAGGIPGNSTIGNFPVLSGDVGTQTGVVAQDSSAFFLPGIYSIRAELRVRSGIDTKGVILNLMPAKVTSFPWGGAGGGLLVKMPLIVTGVSNTIVLNMNHRIYMPIEWFIRLDVGQVALVDADIFTFHIWVDNEYVLDEQGSLSH